MTVTRDVLDGVAGLINTAGIATYNTAGVYQSTDTGIFVKILPDGDTVPDRCVTLNIVPLTDDLALPELTVMVQVTCRGVRNDPYDPDDIADPIYQTLQGVTAAQFGDTTVMQCGRKGSVPMGQDAQGRYIRIDKYFLDLSTTPTTNRPQGGWA